MSANWVQKLFRKLWRVESSMRPEADDSLTPAQARVVRLAQKFPPMHRFRPAIVRALYWALEQPFSLDRVPMSRIVDYRFAADVSSTAGDEMGLRVYYPTASIDGAPRPAMVYYHGGGCVIGSVATHDILCRFIAEKTGLVVLSVDYRCAPGVKFPVPVEDAISAWNWVSDNAQLLGIDIGKTGVGGDSAGAYLATSVCLQFLQPALKHKPQVMPAYQWLLYPMLDLRGETASYQRCTDGMLLTRDFMFYLRDHYLNDLSEASDPIASPVLTESLAGLPPTYVLTLQHDPLVDEGQCYVALMQDQGCQVEHQHHPNCMHGFVTFAGVCPDAHQVLVDAAQGLKILVQGKPYRPSMLI